MLCLIKDAFSYMSSIALSIRMTVEDKLKMMWSEGTAAYFNVV